MRVLLSAGVYLPRARLPRSSIAAAHGWFNPNLPKSGERTYAAWDEDSLTLAVEAVRACTAVATSAEGNSTLQRSFGALAFASTTFPFADRSNAGLVAAALGREGALQVRDHGGSLRAGTSALLAALQALADPACPETVVVASDTRRAKPASVQESQYGHGAAAFRLGRAAEGAAVLAEYLGGAAVTADFVDHHRSDGEDFDYTLEERWVRDEAWGKLLPGAVGPALAAAGVAASAIDHCVVNAPAAVHKKLAAQLGLREGVFVDTLGKTVGDTGTPQALLLLAAALEKATPGALLLLIGFGQGIDALVFRAGSLAGSGAAASAAASGTPAENIGMPPGSFRAALAAGRQETSYTRYLAHQGLLEMELGMRGERDNRTAQSVAWRKRRTVTAFIGGRCRDCNTVQYPLTRACVNPACRAFDTQEEFPLADSPAKVKTFTEDWLAFTPAPPLVYGNVAFAAGGNAFIEFTDATPGDTAVGQPVRFVFRLKDRDVLRGFHRYFWKAVPVSIHGHGTEN